MPKIGNPREHNNSLPRTGSKTGHSHRLTEAPNTPPQKKLDDFRRWGREGGLTGRKTPRRTCPKCKSFVGPDGACKRCERTKSNATD